MRRTFLNSVTLLLAVLIIISSTACGYQANAKSLSAGYKRNISDDYTVSDVFTASVNKFAMSLFSQAVSSDDKNALISPFSAFCCLALITNGADGNTLSQLEQALGINVTKLNRSAYSFSNDLHSSKKCRLSIANSVWYNNSTDKLNVAPDFLQTNADWYDSDIFSADFDQKTVDDINSWCKENTNSMINNLISEIDPSTVMYLFNAIAFDSEWAEPYKKNQINAGYFRNHDGTSSPVEMMSSVESKYFKYYDAVGFAKNYSGNAYSFVGILPDEGTDIYEFARSMDLQFWNGFFDSKTLCNVNVRIPEYKYETDIMNFNEALQSMGITDIFDSSTANLSKMGSSPMGDLYLRSVFQKAVIDVSRNGTKAAAITSGSMNTKSCEPEERFVYLDRPFIFAIVDNSTNIPLFMGITANVQ